MKPVSFLRKFARWHQRLSLTVIRLHTKINKPVSTLKMAYTYNVCDFSQDNPPLTFFYLISFQFLVPFVFDTEVYTSYSLRALQYFTTSLVKHVSHKQKQNYSMDGGLVNLLRATTFFIEVDVICVHVDLQCSTALTKVLT